MSTTSAHRAPAARDHVVGEAQSTDPASSDTAAAVEQTEMQSPAKKSGWFTARRVLTTVAIVAATIYVLDEFVKYRVIAKRFGVVYPGEVYRSGQISKWMFEKTIQANGIQVVIDLNGIEQNDEHQEAEIASSKKLGLEHHRFPLGGDGRGDIRRYADAIEVIAASRAAGRPVLVHCAAGTQRTGGVVATYRMLVEGEPPAKAWDEMMQYGWKPAKEQELLDYVNDNMAELARLLVERGVIAQIPEPLPRLAR